MLDADNLINTVNNLDTANTQGNVELQHNKPGKKFVHVAKETARPFPDDSPDILLTDISDKEPYALNEEHGKHVYKVLKSCSDNANNTPTSPAQIGLHEQSNIQDVETVYNASPIGPASPAACLSYQDLEEVGVQITAQQSSNWELQASSSITIPERCTNVKQQKQGTLSYCAPLTYKPPEADLGKKRPEEHCILESKPEILEDQDKGESVHCQRKPNSLVIAHKVSKSSVSTKCGGSNGQCEQSLTSERPASSERPVSEAESLGCDDNFIYSILLTGCGVVYSHKFSTLKARADNCHDNSHCNLPYHSSDTCADSQGSHYSSTAVQTVHHKRVLTMQQTDILQMSALVCHKARCDQDGAFIQVSLLEQSSIQTSTVCTDSSFPTLTSVRKLLACARYSFCPELATQQADTGQYTGGQSTFTCPHTELLQAAFDTRFSCSDNPLSAYTTSPACPSTRTLETEVQFLELLHQHTTEDSRVSLKESSSTHLDHFQEVSGTCLEFCGNHTVQLPLRGFASFASTSSQQRKTEVHMTALSVGRQDVLFPFLFFPVPVRTDLLSQTHALHHCYIPWYNAAPNSCELSNPCYCPLPSAEIKLELCVVIQYTGGQSSLCELLGEASDTCFSCSNDLFPVHTTSLGYNPGAQSLETEVRLSHQHITQDGSVSSHDMIITHRELIQNTSNTYLHCLNKTPSSPHKVRHVTSLSAGEQDVLAMLFHLLSSPKSWLQLLLKHTHNVQQRVHFRDKQGSSSDQAYLLLQYLGVQLKHAVETQSMSALMVVSVHSNDTYCQISALFLLQESPLSKVSLTTSTTTTSLLESDTNIATPNRYHCNWPDTCLHFTHPVLAFSGGSLYSAISHPVNSQTFPSKLSYWGGGLTTTVSDCDIPSFTNAPSVADQDMIIVLQGSPSDQCTLPLTDNGRFKNIPTKPPIQPEWSFAIENFRQSQYTVRQGCGMIFQPKTFLETCDMPFPYSGVAHQHSNQDSLLNSHNISFTHIDPLQKGSDKHRHCSDKPPLPLNKVVAFSGGTSPQGKQTGRPVTKLAGSKQGILAMLIQLVSSSKTWSQLTLKHTHDIQQMIHFRSKQGSFNELASLLLQFPDTQLKQAVERLYGQCMSALMAVSSADSQGNHYSSTAVLAAHHKRVLTMQQIVILQSCTGTLLASQNLTQVASNGFVQIYYSELHSLKHPILVWQCSLLNICMQLDIPSDLYAACHSPAKTISCVSQDAMLSKAGQFSPKAVGSPLLFTWTDSTCASPQNVALVHIGMCLTKQRAFSMHGKQQPCESCFPLSLSSGSTQMSALVCHKARCDQDGAFIQVSLLEQSSIQTSTVCTDSSFPTLTSVRKLLACARYSFCPELATQQADTGQYTGGQSTFTCPHTELLQAAFDTRFSCSDNPLSAYTTSPACPSTRTLETEVQFLELLHQHTTEDSRVSLKESSSTHLDHFQEVSGTCLEFCGNHTVQLPLRGFASFASTSSQQRKTEVHMTALSVGRQDVLFPFLFFPVPVRTDLLSQTHALHHCYIPWYNAAPNSCELSNPCYCPLPSAEIKLELCVVIQYTGGQSSLCELLGEASDTCFSCSNDLFPVHTTSLGYNPGAQSLETEVRLSHQHITQDGSVSSHDMIITHRELIQNTSNTYLHCLNKTPSSPHKVRHVTSLSAGEQDVLAMLFHLLSSPKSWLQLLLKHTHNVQQRVHFRDKQGSSSDQAYLLLQYLGVQLKHAVETQSMSALMVVSVHSNDTYCQISALFLLQESPLSKVSLTTSTTTTSLLESDSSIATPNRYRCDWPDTCLHFTHPVLALSGGSLYSAISHPEHSQTCQIPLSKLYYWGGGLTTTVSDCSGDMPSFTSAPPVADHNMKNVLQGSPSDQFTPPLTGSEIKKLESISNVLPDCSQSVRMNYPQHGSELNPKSQELLIPSTSPPPCNFVISSGAGVTSSNEHKAANTRGILDSLLPHPNTIGTTGTSPRAIFPQGKKQHNGFSPPSQMKSFPYYNKCLMHQPIPATPNVISHPPVPLPFNKHTGADTKAVPDNWFPHPNTISTMSVLPMVKQGKEQHNGLCPPTNMAHTTPISYNRYSTQQTNVVVPKTPKEPSVFTKPQKVTHAHRTISTFTGGECLWAPTPSVLAISPSPVGLLYLVSIAPSWNNTQLQEHQQVINLELSPTSSEDTQECTDGESQDSGQKSKNSDSSESSGGQDSSSESGGGGAGDGEGASGGGGGGTGGGADGGGGGASGGGGGKDHRNGVSNDHNEIQMIKEQQENGSQQKSDSGLGSEVPSSANVDHVTRKEFPSTAQELTTQTQMLLSQSKKLSFTASPSNCSTLHTQEVASFNEGVKDETQEPHEEESHNTISSSKESVVPSGIPLTTQPSATSSKQGRNLDDENKMKVLQESNLKCDFPGELAMLQPPIFQKVVVIPPSVADEEGCLPSSHIQSFKDTTSGELVPRLECFEDYLTHGEQEVASHASGTGVENSTELHPGSPEVYTETVSAQTLLHEPTKRFVSLAEHKSMEELSCSKESNSDAHCQEAAVFLRVCVSC